MKALTTTKAIVSSRSQAVRIPKEYRFAEDEELVINRTGDSIIITPKKFTCVFVLRRRKLTG